MWKCELWHRLDQPGWPLYKHSSDEGGQKVTGRTDGDYYLVFNCSPPETPINISTNTPLSVLTAYICYLSLSVCLFLSLSLSQSFCFTLCIFLSPSLYLSVSLFLSLSLSQSFCFSICLPLCLFLKHSFSPSLSPSHSLGEWITPAYFHIFLLGRAEKVKWWKQKQSQPTSLSRLHLICLFLLSLGNSKS